MNLTHYHEGTVQFRPRTIVKSNSLTKLYQIKHKKSSLQSMIKKLNFPSNSLLRRQKTLLLFYNTTEKKLLSALELGGLPNPSIAIMKAENTRGNNDFGNISSKIISNKLLDI